MLKIVHNQINVPSRNIVVPSDSRTRSTHPYVCKHVIANVISRCTMRIEHSTLLPRYLTGIWQF